MLYEFYLYSKLLVSFLLTMCYFLNSHIFGLFFAETEAEFCVAYFLIICDFWKCSQYLIFF